MMITSDSFEQHVPPFRTRINGPNSEEPSKSWREGVFHRHGEHTLAFSGKARGGLIGTFGTEDIYL